MIKKIISNINTKNFQKSFRSSMGRKAYKNLPREYREIIHEMNKCQEEGAPIGTMPIKEQDQE